MLIRDFYHNAQLDDFKTGIVTFAGDKEIHLTEAFFAEALEIPIENRKIFEADRFEYPTSNSCILKDPSARVIASYLLKDDRCQDTAQVMCA